MRRLAFLIPLVLSGCFAVNDPSAHEPVPVAPDEFCTVFSELFCSSIECGDCGPGLGGESQQEACLTGFNNFCRQSYGELLVDPRTGYDSTEMAVQLATGRRLVSMCGSEFWEWASRPDGLLSGFTGTVPTGGSCDPQFVETARRLDTPRFLSCEGTDVCLEAATGWRCQTRLPVGSECYAGQCEAHLTCVGHNAEDPTQTGICGTTRVGAGEPCNEESDCESFSCDLAINTGRCNDQALSYCSIRDMSCDQRRFVFGSNDSGPIADQGVCETLVACLTTEQAMEAPFVFDCREVLDPAPAESVDLFCNGFEQVCVAAPGQLDEVQAAQICLSTVSSTPPLYYCGPG